jgi:hypothetical protein
LKIIVHFGFPLQIKFITVWRKTQLENLSLNLNSTWSAVLRQPPCRTRLKAALKSLESNSMVKRLPNWEETWGNEMKQRDLDVAAPLHKHPKNKTGSLQFLNKPILY